MEQAEPERTTQPLSPLYRWIVRRFRPAFCPSNARGDRGSTGRPAAGEGKEEGSPHAPVKAGRTSKARRRRMPA